MQMTLFDRLLFPRHVKAPRDERASKTEEHQAIHRNPKPDR